MIFEKLEVTSFLMNCYIIGCEKSKNCAIVDPGGEAEVIINRISELGLEPKMILLTHGHGDHIGGVELLKQKYGAPIHVHSLDSKMIKDPDLNHSYRLFRKNISLDYDVLVRDKDVLELGDLRIEVIHTPGHTPGGVCYKIDDIILTGDTIFQNSIGRTDFEGGSMENIINSIVNKILIFDDKTELYPGHNDSTTVEEEKKYNMFVRQYFK